jgi:hypothetical protein
MALRTTKYSNLKALRDRLGRCSAATLMNLARHGDLRYLVGIAPAPDAEGAGTEDATAAGMLAAPGTSAAPLAAALAGGAAIAGRSSTLPALAGCDRSLEK